MTRASPGTPDAMSASIATDRQALIRKQVTQSVLNAVFIGPLPLMRLRAPSCRFRCRNRQAQGNCVVALKSLACNPATNERLHGFLGLCRAGTLHLLRGTGQSSSIKRD